MAKCHLCDPEKRNDLPEAQACRCPQESALKAPHWLPCFGLRLTTRKQVETSWLWTDVRKDRAEMTVLSFGSPRCVSGLELCEVRSQMSGWSIADWPGLTCVLSSCWGSSHANITSVTENKLPRQSWWAGQWIGMQGSCVEALKILISLHFLHCCLFKISLCVCVHACTHMCVA